MEEGFKLIGDDCVAIIKDYVEQLEIAEKYNNCMIELKRSVYYHQISDRFSMLVFNGLHYHYYMGQDGYLMMIRYMNEGINIGDYLHNRNIEIVYLFN